ncbi:MAG TPA: type I-E CRISPR-associated protein Cas6/Cse3/CasE [Longimicrobiales bacterium]
MTTHVWTRAAVRLTPHVGHDPRYLLHQAVCTLWDGRVRPVWRMVRETGDGAEIVILSRDMTTGRPCGRWGRVEGVRVGPVHIPEPGERVVFAGSIVATAKPMHRNRVELSGYYRDEDPNELYAAYIQRRIGDVATVRCAEVYGIRRHVMRRGGRRSRTIYYDAADVGGTMEVHDGAGLVEALCDGVGRGKAFGFGLLTLSGEGWSWWR